MIAINVTEFRGNVKKYLAAAENERLIIHNAKGKAYAIIPVEEVEEPTFELTEMQKRAIDLAFEDIENGRVHSHESVAEQTKQKFPHLFSQKL
jgi:PHD/YefM family antitoxin component YafN of YafNO toxin-antitoxin module